MTDLHKDLETRQLRRMRAEDRMLAKNEAREIDAAQQIGQLCREGKTVYYVYPVGGKYREGSFGDLINFLLRNNYA